MKKHLLLASFALSLFASDYETHLPADVYTDVAGLIDETLSTNSVTAECEKGTAQLDIKVEDESVIMLYVPASVEDNFSGVQVGFKDGELIGYAVFDGEGKDFVATPTPAFTEEEQKEMTTYITDVVLPVFEEKAAE